MNVKKEIKFQCILYQKLQIIKLEKKSGEQILVNGISLLYDSTII